MNYKKIICDIVTGVVTDITVYLILALGVALSPFIGPKTLLIAIFMACLVGIVKTFWMNTGHFKWWYKYKKNVHIFEIHPEQRMKQSEEIYLTKSNKNFNSKITSTFVFNDVKVNSLNFNCKDGAAVKCSIIDEFGRQTEYTNQKIEINNKPITAKYTVDFPFNQCTDVSFFAEMDYDSNTAPEYFVDIKRPIKCLIIKVKVFQGVQINNVKKRIIPLYGEYNVNSKKIKGILIDSKDEINCKVYTIKIKNPLLLHRYVISWKWIEM